MLPADCRRTAAGSTGGHPGQRSATSGCWLSLCPSARFCRTCSRCDCSSSAKPRRLRPHYLPRMFSPAWTPARRPVVQLHLLGEEGGPHHRYPALLPPRQQIPFNTPVGYRSSRPCWRSKPSSVSYGSALLADHHHVFVSFGSWSPQVPTLEQRLNVLRLTELAPSANMEGKIRRFTTDRF